MIHLFLTAVIFDIDVYHHISRNAKSVYLIKYNFFKVQNAIT